MSKSSLSLIFLFLKLEVWKLVNNASVSFYSQALKIIIIKIKRYAINNKTREYILVFDFIIHTDKVQYNS